MNYIKQVNTFYKLLPNNPLSSNAQCLYNYLLNKNNELGWIKEFTVSNMIVCGFTNLSRQALDRARNELKTKGYIDYKKGMSNQAGKYLMVEFVAQNDTQKSLSVDFVTQNNTQDITQSDTQDSTQGGHTVSILNKQNKTKQNETIVAAITECLGLVSPFVLQECLSYSGELPVEVIVEALERTSRANGNWNYCKKILNDWGKNGINTMQKIETSDLKHRSFSRNKQETEEERKARIMKEMEEYQKNDNGRVYR